MKMTPSNIETQSHTINELAQAHQFSPSGQSIHARGLFMMDVPHDRQQMGSPVGVRHRDGQSETPAPKRVPRRQESDSPSPPSRPDAPFRPREIHPR